MDSAYERFSIEGVELTCPFSLIPRNVIFVYYLIQGISGSIDANSIPSLDLLSSKSTCCTDLTHCRTVWNIIWSCLTTIFSCTWVAIHPNIPCPRKQNPVVSFAEHRLPLFVCALLVPEYILAWAIRQFWSARKLAKNDRREQDTLFFNHLFSLIIRSTMVENSWILYYYGRFPSL